MIYQLIDSGGVGGAERHVETLATSLIAQGLPTTVLLYAAHGTNPWLDQLAAADVPFRVLDNSARGVFRALVEARPRLLHVHGYKAGVIGRVAARLHGIPVVTTFHSGARGAFPLGAYERLDEWTSFLGPRISVSEAIARRLPFPSQVIPSFIKSTTPPPGASLPRRIGFVGRFSAEKRPDLFCEIARRIGDAVEWHMYGDGPLRGGLEDRYGNLVRFHGVEPDMSRVWPHLGALLMPSTFEGLPLAALEALSAGVPVIASNVGDLAKVVVEGATGWLFPVSDVDAAVARITTLLALDVEAQYLMRQSCWEHVVAHFSERAHLPAVLAVYRRAGLSIA